MTSGEKDFTSTNLIDILPSYIINEVKCTKSEKSEEKSLLSDDIKLVRILYI